MDWGEEAWGFVQDDGGILAQTSSSVRDLSSTAHRTPEERAQRGLGVDADNDKGDEDRLVKHQLDPPLSTKKDPLRSGRGGFRDHCVLVAEDGEFGYCRREAFRLASWSRA